VIKTSAQLGKGIPHISQTLLYLETAPDDDQVQLSVLQLLREQAAEKRRVHLKRSDILTFFISNK